MLFFVSTTTVTYAIFGYVEEYAECMAVMCGTVALFDGHLCGIELFILISIIIVSFEALGRVNIYFQRASWETQLFWWILGTYKILYKFLGKPEDHWS